MTTRHVDQRHILISRSCVAVLLQRTCSDAQAREDGHTVFADFLQQNSVCFWNACLTRSVASLEYRGCLVPCTLLISGTDVALEVVRSAWARRVLRPPKGYAIDKLGDVDPLEMSGVPQTQFAPLPEALCKVVADGAASPAAIRRALKEGFPQAQPPGDLLLHRTLGALVRDRKIRHDGRGYLLASAEAYRRGAPSAERPLLMSEEEAIARLHGPSECSLAVQVDEMDIAAAASVQDASDVQLLGRSHSLKILRVKASRPKSSHSFDRSGSLREASASKRISYLASELGSTEMADFNKSEKRSILTKLLRRMQALTEKSSKQASFSAQFPPLEWSQTSDVLCHSVATQTLFKKMCPKSSKKKSEQKNPKVPWEEADQQNGSRMTYYFDSDGTPKVIPGEPKSSSPKKTPVLLRHSPLKYSPTHRYSYGPLNSSQSKRRQKHNRSTSESPKILKAANRQKSSRSNSPADNSDAKLSFDSSTISGCSYESSKDFSNSSFRMSSYENSIAKYPHRTLPSDTSNLTVSSKSPLKPNLNALTKPSSPSIQNYTSKCNGDYSLDRSKFAPSKIQTLSPALTRPVEDKSLSSSPKNTHFSPSPNRNLQNLTNAKDWRNSIRSFSKASDSKPVKQESKQEPPKLIGINSPLPSFRGEGEGSENNHELNKGGDRDKPISIVAGKAKLASSESGSDSMSCTSMDSLRKSTVIKPLVLKNLVEIPKITLNEPVAKEVVIDNSVSVEVKTDKNDAAKNKNLSTTVVTEETTVTRGSSKVVTVTSITTSLSKGGMKVTENECSKGNVNSSVNDLNIETTNSAHIIDCSSSCNIITEVK